MYIYDIHNNNTYTHSCQGFFEIFLQVFDLVGFLPKKESRSFLKKLRDCVRREQLFDNSGDNIGVTSLKTFHRNVFKRKLLQK